MEEEAMQKLIRVLLATVVKELGPGEYELTTGDLDRIREYAVEAQGTPAGAIFRIHRVGQTPGLDVKKTPTRLVAGFEQ